MRNVPIVSALTVALAISISACEPGEVTEVSPEALAAEGPRREPRVPPAGAADYLHFGPNGLCFVQANTHGVEPGRISRQFDGQLIFIRGGTDSKAETLVEIQTDTHDTSDPYDDTLEIRVTVASAALGDDVDTASLPLYEPAPAIGGMTTKNEPQELFVKKIEFFGGDAPTALINDSRVPMYASGFFTTVSSGQAGFNGGDGPDCVHGSNNDDVIRTRGGADFVRGKHGNDLITGGDDWDTIQGGADDDILRGGGGADLLQGEGGDDCHDGGQDGLRDVLDDISGADSNTYVIEEGTVNGVAVETIEFITEGETLLGLVIECQA